MGSIVQDRGWAEDTVVVTRGSRGGSQVHYGGGLAVGAAQEETARQTSSRNIE